LTSFRGFGKVEKDILNALNRREKAVFYRELMIGGNK
jgi:hypothetical protein